MKVASFSSSLIVGSFADVLLELLVRDVEQDLLAVRPDCGDLGLQLFGGLRADSFFPPESCHFLAGAFLGGAADFADFAVVGDEGFLAAAFLAVELDELEDTNYLSVVVQGIFRKRRGRDKTRTCQQPHGHCGTATKARRPRSGKKKKKKKKKSPPTCIANTGYEQDMANDVLEPHPLVRLLEKPAADFTCSDLVRRRGADGAAPGEPALCRRRRASQDNRVSDQLP